MRADTCTHIRSERVRSSRMHKSLRAKIQTAQKYWEIKNYIRPYQDDHISTKNKDPVDLQSVISVANFHYRLIRPIKLVISIEELTTSC